MNNITTVNTYLFKVSMLLGLVCLALEEILSVSLDTSDYGWLLLIAWGAMAITMLTSLMSYIIHGSVWGLYMLLTILAVNIIFFGDALDSGLKNILFVLLLAVSCWLVVVEWKRMKKSDES